MTVSFSRKAITEVVMARVALRRHLHPERPAMLTRDHDAALAPLVEEAFSAICLAMIPYIGDSASDQADDIMTIELRSPHASGRAAEVRIALEAAMAAYVLQLAFEGTDDGYAARLAEEYAALTGRVRRLCGDSATATIRPFRY